MRDLPVLFSGPMVRAILDGHKTQTRRILKVPRWVLAGELDFGDGWPEGADQDGAWHRLDCPFGRTGDRLWVRETHAFVPATAYRASVGVEQTVNPQEPHEAAIYREGFDRSTGGIRWRPSIHMPRWASRFTLEIISVRVERLQDISEADAAAEGVERDKEPCDHVRQLCEDIGCLGPTHRAAFGQLWEDLNGPGAWRANPWVWVLDFRKVTS